MRQPVYVYILEMVGGPSAIFTWPNVARKYCRDIYTNADGELHLPPADRLVLRRYKVNPKAGHAMVIDKLDVERFLAGK